MKNCIAHIVWTIWFFASIPIIMMAYIAYCIWEAVQFGWFIGEQVFDEINKELK